ncbi:hypothetical protein B9Z65_2375 [Elsinoe australis]|uniref:Uncharacterized protein n=1 Tax=Elsinoe australis TaxID=40998 RepID=A0A2P7ZAL2_9PEZI|nr:hypothetical protein B9Z65_2375 [Elsinoe australis]
MSSSQPTAATSQTSHLYLLAVPLLLPILILSVYPSRVLRWFQRKRYQYEVTFSLYMLTPTEKFIFNSILFLFLAMVLIATALYLPQSISNVLRRGWYYLLGDTHELESLREVMEGGARRASDTLLSETSKVSQEVVETVTSVVDRVKEAVSSRSS